MDIRNIYPVLTYSVVIYVVYKAVRHARVPYLIGVSLLIVPLVPALNILFPVGTVLAERLLFLPSIGACLLISEMLTNEYADLWMYLSNDSNIGNNNDNSINNKNSDNDLVALFDDNVSKKNKKKNKDKDSVNRTKHGIGMFSFLVGMNSLLVLILPVILLASIRVVTRNSDWNSEVEIYRSALDVCPHSVKALTNYATLALNTGISVFL
jgi:hypothetical protein